MSRMLTVQNINKQRLSYRWSSGRPQGKFTWRPRGTIRIESTQIRWLSWWEAEPPERGLKATQGGHQARVHSDQMVLLMARKGNKQAWVHSDQMVLVVVRQEGWVVAKDTQIKSEKTLGSQGILKRWDVEDNADDEAWTTVLSQIRAQQQHWVLKSLLSEHS